MKNYLILGIVLALLSTALIGAVRIFKSDANPETPAPLATPFNAEKGKIQVALILDTSNSMDGLIEQAKSQLWKLVNELADYKKDETAPLIEIALYQYGNDNLSMTEGYVQNVNKLSSDLDMLSEQLFRLTTRGGSEYCGWAIGDALKELAWSDDQEDLRLIFIAGNEEFNQGSVDFRKVCKKANERGIVVNTIFCGDYFLGEKVLWKEGADFGGGTYMNIDHTDQVVHVPTPFDDKIMRLNQKLNDTYIHCGSEGRSKKELQLAQDQNASQYSQANARQRAISKSKKVYKNTSWDLVDFMSENDISKLETSTLPDSLQNLSKSELEALAQLKSQEREAVQKALKEYDEKVKKFLIEHQKDKSAEQTLDKVMFETIQKQAQAKRYKKNK